MKQHITFKQLDELSAETTVRLFNWGMTHKYLNDKEMFLPNIGQMIEFLDENTNRAEDTLAIDAGEHQFHVYHLNKPDHFTCPELADALWEAVKEKLEEE